MQRLDLPLRFDPFLRPMVWGGQRLSTLLGKTPASEPIGEAWEVSDHPVHRSVVAAGPHRGRSLRELMEADPAGLLGGSAGSLTRFPWLVKFLDCHDLLSVQVHPDSDVVKRLRPGEGSKTEAWFILHVEPGAQVWAGLKPGVGAVELRAALAANRVVDCLHAVVPKAGDCVFLPAGTVHAVGHGVLMAEIQETSDVTFRLYDWGRVDAHGKGRQLHLDESFASIHWDAGPVTAVAVADWSRPRNRCEPLVNCEAFVLEFRQTIEPIDLVADRMQTLIMLGGSGTWNDGQPVSAGQSWVLPAAMTRGVLRPTGSVAFLLARLP